MASDKPEKRVRAGKAQSGSGSPAQNRIRKSQRGKGFTADWTSADSSLVVAVIASVGARGCAIQFGYTRDGDSYRIRIVGDGEPFDEYLRCTEDVNVWLEGIKLDYQH